MTYNWNAYAVSALLQQWHSARAVRVEWDEEEYCMAVLDTRPPDALTLVVTLDELKWLIGGGTGNEN